ncbi:Wzz/FepE/Etk N-terminal domain-containing protein [Larkinella rosea]|uniref:Lipopolysaccharide biosynthesis protein n=1 Tax=Larkinella rosea TaxID=2025312 RepID=A0A3P1BSJ2_9BACT|nr:Wzz/FepE/Etk N-terminal domain-containing protein [Larkinella rosea]RRB04081.1 lipopolysaccharide biosynthesis protein [Larkinella rosea]
MSLPTKNPSIGSEMDDDDLIQIRPGDILKFIQRSLRAVLVFAVLGTLIGVYYAFSKPDDYKAEVTVMPEASAGSAPGMGNLGSLAGLAGLSIDNAASDVIRPDLYPDVLQSIPFALHMLKQPVYSKNYKTVLPLQAYLQRQRQETAFQRLTGNTDNAPVNPQPAPDNLSDPKNYSKALQISPEQEGLAATLTNRITTTYERRTGIVTIEARMPDPVVAATVARLSLEYLTNYITSYRTQKVRNQERFLIQQVEQSRRRYQAAELELESYRDRNRSLYSGLARISEQRLQAEFLLAQNVYNDLSRQLEQAKIRVQEETPVFKMLEPPRIPLRPNGPRRTLFIFAALAAGVVAGLGWTLLTTVWSRFRRQA